MDVAQIIGTSSAQTRREPDYRDTDYDDYSKDDFASYLDDRDDRPDTRPDQAAAATPPKEAAPTTEHDQASAPQETSGSSEKPTYTRETSEEAAPADPKPTEAKTESNAPQQTGTETTQAAAAQPAVTPVVPASSNAAETTSTAAKPTETAAPAPTAPAADPKVAAPATEAASKAAEATAPTTPQKAANAAAAVVPPAPTETQPKATAQNSPSTKTEASSEKTPAVFTTENTTKPPSAEALEKIRTDANARLAEKDILSTKITELLHNSKGKISLSAAATKTTFQSNLASTTNIVSAAMTENGAVAGAMTQQLGLTENPAGQALPAVATEGIATVKEVMTNVVPTSTGAVQGVDSSAANTASQTANAMRAAGQAAVSDQVAMQINNAAKDGVDRIKISLHPSELGRVEVKMELGHDGRVQAVISADKSETLDILKQDSRALEKALQDAGFETGSGSLKFAMSEQGGGETPNFAESGPGSSDLADDMPLEAEMPAELASSHLNDGNLDIQV
ncbi:MAG: flagellar hook-length control protein FliK [Proteobacteria bacterium]|nr:flagellar hook-length control protein FliK [Pseudomonadota bacterium]